MRGMRILLALAAAAALAVPAAAAAAAPKLTGTVGPGFTIVLKQGAARATKLRAGTYTIVVHARSSDHDFRLAGPGFSRSTTVEGTGTSTWSVRLRPGSYRYFCDPHE